MRPRLDVSDLDVLVAIATVRAEAGRCSIADVAERVGMSHKGVHYRLVALRERGIVWWQGRGRASTIYFGLPAEAARTRTSDFKGEFTINMKGDLVRVKCEPGPTRRRPARMPSDPASGQ